MSNTRLYVLAILFAVATFGIDFLGWMFTKSMGLLSDGLHIPADKVTLLLGLADAIAQARGETSRFRRWITPLNAVLLAGVGFGLLLHAAHNWSSEKEVTSSVLYFALGSAVGNGLQYLYVRRLPDHVHGGGHTPWGQKLHFLLDWAGSVGVLLAAAVIWQFGWMRADAVAEIVVGLSSLLAALILFDEFLKDEHAHPNHPHSH